MIESVVSSVPISSIAERFWGKVKKRPHGCWEWTGCLHPTGYGAILISLGGRRNHRVMKAHRLSWMLAHGTLDSELCVLHRCDNPKCVRPDHLFLGTSKDNSDDKLRKGRQRNGRGERNSHAKVTAHDVVVIRETYARGGISQQAIADQYGITQAIVSKIVLRQLWKHVA